MYATGFIFAANCVSKYHTYANCPPFCPSPASFMHKSVCTARRVARSASMSPNSCMTAASSPCSMHKTAVQGTQIKAHCHQQQLLGQLTRRGQYKRRVACRVLTESAEMTIGSRAPDFELPDVVTGKPVSLTAAAAGAKATLVMFICNHCPFVVMLKSAIAAVAREYQQKGVSVVAISSNSVQTHPQDGPEKMAQEVKEHGYTFPYLYDESQSVAKSYHAACTPEFYVFDKDLKLVYHGQFDDARPNNGKAVTGLDIRVALDAAVAGSSLPEGFMPKRSIGCNIKWHPGQEPDYYGTQIVKK